MSNREYVNEDFFQILGHISVFFATLDFLVTLLMMRLIDYEKTKHKSPINEKTTLKQKFRILRDLSDDKVFDVDILTKFREFLDEAIEISEKRNRYIHDQWLFSPELIKSGKIGRLTLTQIAEGTINPKGEKLTIEELKEFLNEIGSLQKRVNELFDKLPQSNQLKNAKFLKRFIDE